MQRFSDYCLSKIPQAMRDDAWAQEIFQSCDYGLDDTIQNIRDLEVWEDFFRMPLYRLYKFETMLDVRYYFTDETRRRDTVRAYWMGWGNPSVGSVKTIVELMTQHSAVVTYDSENFIMHIDSSAEDVPDDIRPALIELLRRHLPAWVDFTFRMASNYMSVSEVNSATIGTLANKKIENTDDGDNVRK